MTKNTWTIICLNPTILFQVVITIRKLQQFIDNHCRKGGKYVQYLKFECEGKNGTRCDFCEGNEWIGPACTFVPPPTPNESRLPKCHFKHVRDTQAQINGCMREIDDLQPRIQTQKEFRPRPFKINVPTFNFFLLFCRTKPY